MPSTHDPEAGSTVLFCSHLQSNTGRFRILCACCICRPTGQTATKAGKVACLCAGLELTPAHYALAMLLLQLDELTSRSASVAAKIAQKERDVGMDLDTLRVWCQQCLVMLLNTLTIL